MKNVIVVVKPGIDPNMQTVIGVKSTGITAQLQFKPVYDEEQRGMSAKENDNPRLSQLKDKMSRSYSLSVNEENAEAVIRQLEESGIIESYEENEENHAYFISNDPLYSSLHGLKKIQASAVWDIGITGKNIIVAVVDTGIDVDHPDLNPNLWEDSKGNHGFNVIDDSNDLKDESEHGTHVSGTIAAVVNNSIGIAGVAPGCLLMSIKGLQGPTGSGRVADLAKGIRKAVDNGAHVINNSWGPGTGNTVKDAIEYAILHNVVVVFAAGNDNRVVRTIDAAGNPNVISVAATDENDNRASFTNFGPAVSVSAPGVDILSTTPGKNYKRFNGTSMAAPHVAGLAALILSKNSNLNHNNVKAIIMNNCDALTGVPTGQPIGRGRINALKTITATPL
ncbi:MAG: S8 family peptidase [Agriterribacter sp.]